MHDLEQLEVGRRDPAYPTCISDSWLLIRSDFPLSCRPVHFPFGSMLTHLPVLYEEQQEFIKHTLETSITMDHFLKDFLHSFMSLKLHYKYFLHSRSSRCHVEK